MIRCTRLLTGCPAATTAFRPLVACSQIRYASTTHFTKDHEWIRVDESKKVGTIGITKFAADALGDIVFVELPKTGSIVKEGAAFGVVESTKAASDVYSPVTGTVNQVNKEAEKNPALISQDPHNKGWLIEVEFSKTLDFSSMMNAEAYEKFCLLQK
jgi:glycine cleavage system H protein